MSDSLQDVRMALVAGEASGDLIAAASLEGLAARGLGLEGIGGPRLKALGMDCWAPAEALAVRGYVEALSRLPAILAIRRQLLARLRASPPKVFMGVDAPDFNLGVERQLRAMGVTTVHFISPTIWAWRPERLHAIAQSVDHLLCLFPFEPELYRGTRVQAEFVGHPLADRIAFNPDRKVAQEQLGLDRRLPVLAVLPGSRRSEIQWIGPAFLQASAMLARDWQVIIPAASPQVAQQIQALPDWQAARDAGVRLLVPDETVLSDAAPLSHQALAAADLVLVASGTATLEAALVGRPMVIGYRVPPLTHWLMRRKAQVAHVGLPNLLLGRSLVTECLQAQCESTSLVSALRGLSEDAARQEEMRSAFEALHATLRQSATTRVGERRS
ncbi:MAG: lipid-A-disaccharide synthase [Burkholderiaceae bacterium]